MAPPPTRPSLRKLVGSILMMALVVFYAFAALTLAQGPIERTPVWLQMVLYAILGICWIFPAMAIIKWMERPAKK